MNEKAQKKFEAFRDDLIALMDRHGLACQGGKYRLFLRKVEKTLNHLYPDPEPEEQGGQIEKT